MEYVELGASGFEVSRICAGCMSFGDPQGNPGAWTLAQKHGATMAQVALAWQFAKGVASPVVGTTKPGHFDDAAGAFRVKLSAEDVAYLEEPYAPRKVVGAL
jgi:aryl-alcohol dehydrogenase-like predicted oxidoreductase